MLESVTGVSDVNLKTVWRIADTVIVEVHALTTHTLPLNCVHVIEAMG